jgi:hypothetical protein
VKLSYPYTEEKERILFCQRCGHLVPSMQKPSTRPCCVNRSTTCEHTLPSCVGPSVLWHLFLHPDILDIVEQEFDLPAEIVSDKTCLGVFRSYGNGVDRSQEEKKKRKEKKRGKEKKTGFHSGL